MSVPQKIYRIYSFDLSRKVVTADFLKAGDDEEAIAKAEAGSFGTKCELWDGERLIAHIDPERRQA